ncbi:hypothetical protein WG8_1219 [Paenibacillus sp. Aloe-11]|nr:hypothetical protein WG8_1219 [Paenibacillus sp. Aloe-11]
MSGAVQPRGALIGMSGFKPCRSFRYALSTSPTKWEVKNRDSTAESSGAGHLNL